MSKKILKVILLTIFRLSENRKKIKGTIYLYSTRKNSGKDDWDGRESVWLKKESILWNLNQRSEKNL